MEPYAEVSIDPYGEKIVRGLSRQRCGLIVDVPLSLFAQHAPERLPGQEAWIFGGPSEHFLSMTTQNAYRWFGSMLPDFTGNH